MQTITLFEQAYLKPDDKMSKACFDWLAQAFPTVFRPIYFQGELCLKIRQFVGVITTPNGTQIEILPKIFNELDQASQLQHARAWFFRVLNQYFLQVAQSHQTISKQQKIAQSLSVMDWLIQQFIPECQKILNHGASQCYQQHYNNEQYLRGKLAVADNIRENNLRMRQHKFAQHNDQRKANTPENRLIFYALKLMASVGHVSANHSLINELKQHFGLILQESYYKECSADQYVQTEFANDKQQIQHQKVFALYQKALPIALMILENCQHGSGLGHTFGFSLLFNMHHLFEKMVFVALGQYCKNTHQLHSQYANANLLQNAVGQPMYQLRPDFVLADKQTQQITTIVDAKWKLMDVHDKHKKTWVNLSQADVYQMFAYGMHYFDATKTDNQIWLVYPQQGKFHHTKTFQFTHNHMHLKLVAFDIENFELQVDS